MFEPNVERVLEKIAPGDVVLDIGGWGRPFNRADWVMDAEPYETRGYYGSNLSAQGGEREYFSADRWIQRDICEHTPYPFQDKELDFVICSHTLEDIRDPLWVCSEMIRIAKRGYLEVPSRLVETCRGKEPGQVGWTHHRWLIDIDGNEVRFLMKYHMIHSHWRFSFPDSFRRSLSARDQVQWLFWDDSFDYREVVIHGTDQIAQELEGYVDRHHPYPQPMLASSRKARAVTDLSRRVGRRAMRLFGGPRDEL